MGLIRLTLKYYLNSRAGTIQMIGLSLPFCGPVLAYIKKDYLNHQVTASFPRQYLNNISTLETWLGSPVLNDPHPSQQHAVLLAQKEVTREYFILTFRQFSLAIVGGCLNFLTRAIYRNPNWLIRYPRYTRWRSAPSSTSETPMLILLTLPLMNFCSKY